MLMCNLMTQKQKTKIVLGKSYF